MTYSKIAWIMLIGSSLFLLAAFNPSAMAFAARTPETKLDILNKLPRLWVVSQFGFGFGAILPAIGYLLLARGPYGANTPFPGILTAVSIGMLIGAGLWGINLVQRASDFEGFARGAHANWPFVVYTVLTLVGLAVWGYAYLQGNMPAWIGWGTLGPAVALFVLFIVFKDMPPFVYYLVNLELIWVLFKHAPK
ncbi:MAG: hypothetical protein KIS88_05800 [Anaerolineales bacterium]|nr:hypothetical protein [Anaerolineales bacterium]